MCGTRDGSKRVTCPTNANLLVSEFTKGFPACGTAGLKAQGARQSGRVVRDTPTCDQYFRFAHRFDDLFVKQLMGELAVGRGLFLRGGYRNKVEGGGGVSTGFGLLLLKKQMPLRFDYAFDDRGRFGGLHTISLEVGR